MPGQQTPPPPQGGGDSASPPLPNLKLHAGESTIAPPYPTAQFDSDAVERLTESQWSALSNDLYMSATASMNARGAFDANLREWAQAYDMIVGQKDFPFVDSSNLSLPYLPAQLESLAAYIVGTALVPRLYMVTGNAQDDPKNTEAAFLIEKFYNDELLRLRSDGTSYFARQTDWVHMSLRDGTGILEILWNRRRQRKRTVSYVPQLDPTTGMNQLDEMGKPQWKKQVADVDVYIKDYAELTPIPLKEFYLIPNEARSIEDAVGCFRVEWLYEDVLDRMVRAGLLDSGEVERALIYVQNGTSDVASDRQGFYDKNASDQFDIGQGQGSVTSEFFVNRGPLKVLRIHSRQFDMNGDGIPEENIFWLHEQSQRMLGWMPYDYASGQRPFIAFCPMPRPDSFYGYSLPERLAGIVDEMEAVHNARRDRQDLGLFPPMAVKEGSMLLNHKGEYRPGGMIEVESLNPADPSYQMFQIPDVPVSSWQEEGLLKSYGNEYTGLNQPMQGAAGSGRRSATELRQQNAASNVRVNLICARLRISLGQVIAFVHQLNKQYLQTSPSAMSGSQHFTLPLDVLSADVTIGIAGASDPIDSMTRRNENMTLFDLAMKVPFIASNPMRVWYWMRSLLESFGRSDVYQLIGTEQDMQQVAQQQMQQMQQQQQLQQGELQGKADKQQSGAQRDQADAMLKKAETMVKIGEAFQPERHRPAEQPPSNN